MSVDKRPSMEKIHIDPKTAAITSKVMARMTVSYVSTQAGRRNGTGMAVAHPIHKFICCIEGHKGNSEAEWNQIPAVTRSNLVLR